MTPLTGAVVLEDAKQYADHDLDPSAGANVPLIPEPSALLLFGTAGLALMARRRVWRM